MLRDFVFQSPLPSTKTDEVVELQTCLQATRSRNAQEQTYQVAIESVRDGQWTTHCEGTVVVSTKLDDRPSSGLGPLEFDRNSGSGTMALQKTMDETSDPYHLHPLTIYRCLQRALVFAASKEHPVGAGGLGLGSSDGLKIVEIEELRILGREEQAAGENWKVLAINRDTMLEDHMACVDVALKDEAGAVIATALGLQVTRRHGEVYEAFDKDVPPPEPNALVPAFLRPLLK